MPRKRAKKVVETRGQYLKRLRAANEETLAGRVITEWEKGGHTVTVEKSGPFSRPMFRREGGRFRLSPPKARKHRPDASPYTKPSLGARRDRRHARNRAARAARRASR
jgi:hypothetical protein